MPYSRLGIEYGEDLLVAPFEYAGPFHYYTDSYGTTHSFGNLSALKTYPVLDKTGAVNFTEPVREQVLSTYSLSAFGKSAATFKYEKISGAKEGIRITIEYTPTAGLFGFGIMLSNTAGTAGITQLYAVGYGTIDHRVYGNWAWNGNYVAASALGVETAEKSEDGKATVTLFYSYETLNLENYNLGITADTETVGLHAFEYVDDASGEYLAIYNCARDTAGNMLIVDCGLALFHKWEFRGIGGKYEEVFNGNFMRSARRGDGSFGLQLQQ